VTDYERLNAQVNDCGEFKELFGAGRELEVLVSRLT
jgi:hypothetical protein